MNWKIIASVSEYERMLLASGICRLLGTSSTSSTACRLPLDLLCSFFLCFVRSSFLFFHWRYDGTKDRVTTGRTDRKTKGQHTTGGTNTLQEERDSGEGEGAGGGGGRRCRVVECG